jgi:hypothetical protein
MGIPVPPIPGIDDTYPPDVVTGVVVVVVAGGAVDTAPAVVGRTP